MGKRGRPRVRRYSSSELQALKAAVREECLKDFRERFGQDWQPELEPLLRHKVDEWTAGEVQPSIKIGDPTQWVTDLVELMAHTRRQTPLVENPRWLSAWHGSPSGEVCPVCHLPAQRVDSEHWHCPACELSWLERGSLDRLFDSWGPSW